MVSMGKRASHPEQASKHAVTTDVDVDRHVWGGNHGGGTSKAE
jgi:hypothetical protein